MEVRCNDSIKRLITSTEHRFDDGLTVEQRLNAIPVQFLLSSEKSHTTTKVPEKGSGKVFDVDTEIVHNEYSMPFGFITKVPKNFDPDKSSSSLVNISFGQHESTEKLLIKEMKNRIDYSNFYNNLDESILLGRAVYSWVRSSQDVYFIRETESHLPEGEYIITLFFGLYEEDIYSFHNPIGPRFGPSRFKCESTPIRATFIEGCVDVHLQLVSKKTKPSKSKKTKKEADPEESVESLLLESDNMLTSDSRC